MSDSDRELLVEACMRWQGGRDGGSSLLRGAARVITNHPHYFNADYITRYEDQARADTEVLAEGRALLAAVATAAQRTADEWNEALGLPPRDFAGRGLQRRLDEDQQIVASLNSGAITMPLWGVSLDPEVAESFGAGDLRFIFEIVGSFPAIPAWTYSDIEREQQELICGGTYRVESIDDDPGHSRVRLTYSGPLSVPSPRRSDPERQFTSEEDM